MHKQPDKPSFFEKLATAIVDRRNLIFFLYLCALIFSLFSQGWVKVCNDLTQYLPENTETRQGLTIMEDEFITYGTARIMLSNVTYDMAANLAAELASIDGVTSVSFGNGTEQDKMCIRDRFRTLPRLLPTSPPRESWRSVGSMVTSRDTFCTTPPDCR